ncbi:MAG TPA: hypothetical protein VK507_00900 [Iamia sp.]|nr:hypothetical protein [Iamia sp.]
MWSRKGTRTDRLPDRRVRTLLRRADVLLVVWESFETTRHAEPDAKVEAARLLVAVAAHPDDVIAHEWRSDGGGVLLMLEHRC